MNVHIRCQANVAPNCGVNSAELAKTLACMGLQPGSISPNSVSIFFPSLFKAFTPEFFNECGRGQRFPIGQVVLGGGLQE